MKICVVVPNLFMYFSGQGSWGLKSNADPHEFWSIITAFDVPCNA